MVLQAPPSRLHRSSERVKSLEVACEYLNAGWRTPDCTTVIWHMRCRFSRKRQNILRHHGGILMAGRDRHDNDSNDRNSRSRKSKPKTSSNGGMSASTGSTQDREPSMGGSQGTREEDRERTRDRERDEARRDASSSSSRDEGGYGADSGYSDASGSSRDRSSSDENARRASGSSDTRSTGDRDSSSSRDSGNDASRRGPGGSGSGRT
jgi:hypothetical protein